MSDTVEQELIGSITESPVDIGKTFDEVLPLIEDQETLIEGTFTWHIEDWSALSDNKYVSPKVKIGEYEWDILLFPNGNRNKGIALYLEPHPTEEATPDWYCCTQFSLSLSRPGDDLNVNLINRSHHRFNIDGSDWGFANFIDQNHLKYPTKNRPTALLHDGKLNITAYIRILKDPTGVLWHNFMNYNSKKVTGYVGFKNQGATCYLNSLLQSYFYTKFFRRLVYQIPTDTESPNNSVPLALQKAFYQLQVSDDPIDTLEVTRSFGWDGGDAFTQHDVQELDRILMERLENKMKNTKVEGKLNEIFVGKMKSFIKCIDVDYESSRVEEFWDLQMNVKNLKNLEESFESYIEIEVMNGENQYAAQDYGLQDAEKGVIFESFPPVLHLQLKRFEYDFNFDQLIKINDRYEFPETIDVSPYLDKDSKEKRPVIYKLHGVLVHAGDISTGHYYTLIKPGIEDKWFRFDDEKVWRVTKKQVFDENFGLDRLPDEEIRSMSRDQYQNYLITRHTSAYMLVYIREDKEEELLQPVDEVEVPQHVVERVKKEMEERAIREKEIRDAHLYVNITIFNLKNFINYQGLDPIPTDIFKFSYQDLNTGKEQPATLKIARTTKMSELFLQIKEKINIPGERDIRYWKMATRQNNTTRITEPLIISDERMTLEEALKSHNDESISSFNLYVEEPYLDLEFLRELKNKNIVIFNEINDELVDDIRTNIDTYIDSNKELLLPNDAIDETESLIFVKQFDIKTQTITGFGYTLINESDKLLKLADLILELTDNKNISTDEITLYEEVNCDNIAKLELKSQFYSSELSDGDIVSFEIFKQIEKFEPQKDQPFYSNILDYYNYLEHRVKLRFSKVSNSTDDFTINEEAEDGQRPLEIANNKFEIWVHANIKYPELADIVGKHTDINPSYLKLFAVYSNGRYSLKSKSTLSDYLMKDYNCNLIPPFLYEELSIPLIEFEHLRPIKFYWLKDSYIHYQSFEFEVSGSFSVDQFLDKAQQKIGFTDDEKNKMLVWTNSNFEFQGILSRDTLFKDISKHFLIFGRVLPEELSLFEKFADYSGRSNNNIHSAITDSDENVNSIEELISLSPTPDSNRTYSNPENEGHLVLVSQYFKDMENKHGISFLFNLIPKEFFPQTKERLHKKFGLGQKEFSKIKIGILYTTPQGKSFKSFQNYSEAELERIVLFDIMSNLDSIFLDHPDRLRSHNSHDRPMVIKN